MQWKIIVKKEDKNLNVNSFIRLKFIGTHIFYLPF